MTLVFGYKIMKSIIFGAGSIGNHLAHASRSLGWDVTVVDNDPLALKRMKNDIYIKRYGAWDEKINLFNPEEIEVISEDLVIIGTPPEFHIPLAIDCIKKGAKNILIEKPLSIPNEDSRKELKELVIQNNVSVWVGYNHSIAPSFKNFLNFANEIFKNSKDFSVQVNWLESWKGIFKAHPWLNGPEDSYLGYTKRGGGALCEHSHGLHLFLCLMKNFNKSFQKLEINTKKIIEKKGTNYDQLSSIKIIDQDDQSNICIQDIFTWPAQKFVTIKNQEKSLKWTCNKSENLDQIEFLSKDEKWEKSFPKSRPLDFFYELEIIGKQIKNKEKCFLDFSYANDVMDIIDLIH